MSLICATAFLDSSARSCGVPELGVHGAQDRVGVHEDLVCGESDEGAPAHRIVGDHHSLLRRVIVQGVGYLGRREGYPTGGVDDDVDGSVVGCEPDGPEDGLAVVDIDVPGNGEAEEAQGLLTVDDGDHVRATLPPQCQKLVPPGTVEGLLAEPGPYEAEDEEDDPEIVEQSFDDVHIN
jgi:hypothetical protein